MTAIDQKSTRPGETSQSLSPVPGLPRPAERAHVIKDDAEAIAVAERLAKDFREGAKARRREGAKARRSATANGSGRWRSLMRFRKAACGRSTCRKSMAARDYPM